MITYTTDKTQVSSSEKGSWYQKTFWCMDADVASGGSGYTIAGLPVDPTDGDLAYTKDTQRCFMYDQDSKAWWEQ